MESRLLNASQNTSQLLRANGMHQLAHRNVRVGTFIHKTPPWDEYGRGSSGCQAGVKVSKSGIGTNGCDATGVVCMTGTDQWMVPEAGLWGAGGRLALENVRKVRRPAGPERVLGQDGNPWRPGDGDAVPASRPPRIRTLAPGRRGRPWPTGRRDPWPGRLWGRSRAGAGGRECV